ncbi:MAG: tripartite tricarboxylate transporter substrate binding protein [Comamonadaceae bacterium]|nr:MAG: tripartite tricarboxylate transporter substrate binding protein [Comamonadaceae bacterium]
MKRRSLIKAAGGLAAVCALPQLHAQSSAAVAKIIVPFAPGAGSDAMARYFGVELSRATGKQYIVENRTGAGGAVGADFVAKAPPDGNTLLFIASPFTTVAAAGGIPKYDPAQFAPVAIMGAGPLLFVSHSSLPGNDLKEAVAYMKANPGKCNYGSAGPGSINHLVVELLKQRTGTAIVHIPYRGIAFATTDLLAGQLQFMTGSVPALMPYIKDGRIKALALTTKDRVPSVPGVPGMEELGFKDFDVSNYWGLMAPPGTPANVTGELNAAINKLIAQPAVTARLRQDATEPTSLEGPAISSFIAKDLDRWKHLITSTKMQLG